jgi:integrase
MRTRQAAKIDTPTARARLTRGERYKITVGATRGGLALFYRRQANGVGSWQARRWNGSHYMFETLGPADDANAPDGALPYTLALERAKAWDRACERRGGLPPSTPGTVSDALDHWLERYRAGQTKKGGGKAIAATENTVNRIIRPELGTLRLTELTADRIRRFLQTLAERGRRVRVSDGQPPRYLEAATDPDAVRARRATANRVFTVLRAALNLAFERGEVPSDEAWRRVSPFPNVDEPRVRFLTVAESTRLVNACPVDLRRLVRAALLTGARFGELAALCVVDFNPDTAQVYIAPSKGGKARYLPLSAEGVVFFTELTAGRRAAEPALLRADGHAWAKNRYVRALQDASTIAKIEPAVTLHELRHTYASLLAQAGCDLLTIAKLLGHADTRVTARHYAHLCDATLQTAVAKLPQFGAGDGRIVPIDHQQRTRAKR